MTVTLTITEEELEKLLERTEDIPNVLWQLRGYWIAGGDERTFQGDN